MGNKPGFIKPYASQITLIQRTFDAFWVLAAHYVACLLYPETWAARHTLATVVAILVFAFVAEMAHLYRAWRGSPLRSELWRVATTWATCVPILLLLAFVTKESATYSRFITLVWFTLTPVFISLWRIAVRIALRSLRAQGRNSRSVAIVGATKSGANLAQRILGSPTLGMKITGYYDDRHPERLHAMPKEIDCLCGTTEALLRDAHAGKVDLVYIALPLRAEERVNELVRKLADTTASVYVVADFFVFDLLLAQWSNVEGMPVVSIFETPFFGVDGWLKRLEDIVLGTLILSLIAIPMAIIAAAIKLTSKGPIFFRQRRYGLNGEEIRVLKFRTMSVCEDGPKVQQAHKNDSRITKIGALLRRTSLDELPQFLNVLSGEMSIVGPRPHAVAHNEEYRRLIHGYMLRHKVKPGITGWAQVKGWRGETDTLEKMERRVEHDLHYIQNWDLLFDIKIILMTIFGGLTHKNAY